MGKFSIRRHKKNLSDTATIVTVDTSMGTSQRSLYGSITSSRHRNRLQKPQHSSDEGHGSPNGTPKRPQRKLVKKPRQQQRSTSPDERTSATPPEQKPHATSLPTTFDHAMGRGYASHNWTDDEIRPPRRRVPYAMRGSVGSSVDVLLTPIRGSTALSDDFVFLPNGHTMQSSSLDSLVSPQSEQCESPKATIETMLTESEPSQTVDHAPLVVNVEDPTPKKLETELEDPNTPLAQSFTSETHTVINTFVEAPSMDAAETSAASPVSAKETSPIRSPSVNVIVEIPVSIPPNNSTHELPVDTTPDPPAKPPLVLRVTNVIPFPSDIEDGRFATPTRAEPIRPTRLESPRLKPIVASRSFEPQNTPWIAWATSAWQTAAGIILIAMECYRWLCRKGMRDDFRSCMSYWFLRELVIGFMLPLCLVPVGLWLLLRTMHLDHEPAAISL